VEVLKGFQYADKETSVSVCKVPRVTEASNIRLSQTLSVLPQKLSKD